MSQLARGRPALTFYPASALRHLFVGHGWTCDRERTLLDPVPWTESHVRARAEATRDTAAELPTGPGGWLRTEADRLETAIEAEECGRMYSLAFRLPP